MNQNVQPVTDLLPIHTLENVKENKTSKREKKKDQIVQYIVRDVKQIPNLCKTNIAWIQRACELIENMVKKKDKIDKWDIIVNVFHVLFPNMPPMDIDLLREMVCHLLDNKLIKKVATSVKLYSFMRKVVISNCLFRQI